MKKNFFLLVYLYKTLWFVSFTLKFLAPKTALTWLRAFLLKFHYFNIHNYNSMKPLWFIFILLLGTESFLFLFLSTRNKILIYINFFVLLFFLFISVLAYVLEIPGSCGCFGALIVWQNDLYKILFNIILTLGAFYLVYNYDKINII